MTAVQGESWSDLDTALFFLDGACQSIVDEWHGRPDHRALRLLEKHGTRIDYLRRDYAAAVARGDAAAPWAPSDARTSDDV